MFNKTTSTFIVALLLSLTISIAQKPFKNDAIISGIPWFDQNGNVVSAHGANIVKDNNRFYLFGEFKSDTSNAFNGFSCYSSVDLYNWEFEQIVLPLQDSGKLGPNRVGERPKVMKCPKTGEYIMFMHVDDMNYKDQFTGYATCKTINGNYQFQGPLLFDGKPIKKWDMGVFQDSDGSGFLLTHSGNLYKLSDDYKSITEQVVKGMTSQCEAPVIFKKDSLYYWIGSHLSSWERNDNYYFTATSLYGPWTERGLIAPKGTLTWNSQATNVLIITGSKDSTYMFMGDRWAFPRQNSAATYVWQPVTISGHTLSMPVFEQKWSVNTSLGTWKAFPLEVKTIHYTDTKNIIYNGNWVNSSISDSLSGCKSNTKGASFCVKFKGTQIGFYGVSTPQSGYANILLQNDDEKTILTSTIDMYCNYAEQSLKFISPILKKGNYKLTVTVTGEHGSWSDKRRSNYGSTDNYIILNKIIIK